MGEIKEPILDFIHDFVNTRRRVTNFLDTVLTVALKPDHPFNAKYLHENLLNREIQDRDHLWTLYLNRRWDPQTPLSLLESSNGPENWKTKSPVMKLRYFRQSSFRGYSRAQTGS